MKKYKLFSGFVFTLSLFLAFLTFNYPFERIGIREMQHVGPLWVAWWWAVCPTVYLALAVKSALYTFNAPLRIVARECTKMLIAFEIGGSIILVVFAFRFFTSGHVVGFVLFGCIQIFLALSLLSFSYWGYKMSIAHKTALAVFSLHIRFFLY